MIIDRFLPINVIHHANSWEGALQQVSYNKYDIVFLGLEISDNLPMLEQLHGIVKTSENLRVCIVPSMISQSDARLAFEKGAIGYIPKTVPSTEAERAISLVMENKTYIPDNLFPHQENDECRCRLPVSPRQLQVLKHVEQGFSNKEISEVLGISENTTKKHLHNTFKILGVKNRAEAVHTARLRRILK